MSRSRILDAFEEAVLLHGIRGASFARIAAIGGFHRSLVQHHFKTRDRLLEAGVARVSRYYLQRLDEIAGPDDPARLDRLLDWMLSAFGADGPPRQAKVVDAFVALASTDGDVREAMEDLYTRFIDAVAEALHRAHPEVDPAAADDFALSVVALSFGRAGLETVGVRGASSGVARAACDQLLKSVLKA